MHLVAVSPDSSENVLPELVMVDADLAVRWLARNHKNRPIRAARVEQYFDDMVGGRWRFNGDTIKFGVDGQLLDGQHRLKALERTKGSGLVLPMLVVRGLPAESQITMDQGAKRTPGDQLALSGLSRRNTTLVAAALRVYIVWMEDGLFGDRVRTAVSATRVVEFADAYPEIVGSAEDLAAVALRIKCRPAVACALAVRLNEIDPAAASEFLIMLDSGAGLSTGSPILALRERLDNIRATKVRTSDRDVLGLGVTAWNLWRDNRSVSKLQRPKGGWTRENFPQPR
ncbi:hypothetical protein GCM10009764_25800 [Nocardia ninae]|uniref:DGQHR domain-containing protein n=2 Tax=Nocardia ninae TaxID=356145 RepID=A0A511MBY3_9NOCA|nr:hypothetical protein NN4_26910 [Nocardia ninae NBRC 108245]